LRLPQTIKSAADKNVGGGCRADFLVGAKPAADFFVDPVTPGMPASKSPFHFLNRTWPFVSRPR